MLSELSHYLDDTWKPIIEADIDGDGSTPVRVSIMHNACMVALQIRDVSEDVRDALATQARARGQSLQAYLLELVQTQARRLRNTAVLDQFAGRSDGTRSLPGETAAELTEQRERRGPAENVG